MESGARAGEESVLLRLKEKISALMLDKLAETFPTVDEPLVRHTIWVTFTPRFFAEAAHEYVEQATIIVVWKAQAYLLCEQLTAIPVQTLISAFCTFPS